MYSYVKLMVSLDADTVNSHTACLLYQAHRAPLDNILCVTGIVKLADCAVGA